MQYPGRVVTLGESDPRVVKALKVALNKVLVLKGAESIQLDPDSPEFGPRMKQAVQLFQLRHVDAHGIPLRSDGQVGPITWASLFGADTVPVATKSSDELLTRAIEVAGAEADKGVREQPVNSNRGPEVDQYLKRAGVKSGLAWCCAFVYWSFDEAALSLAIRNPMYKTAGCLDHWNHAQSVGATRIKTSLVLQDPSLISAGAIFIVDHGGGTGHTGLVEAVGGGRIETIEGNTDASLTREGGGVYRLKRKIVDINKGFIVYGSSL